MTGAAPRLRLSKSDHLDHCLDMRRDVRECNPFEENMRHTVQWTGSTVRLRESHQKVFSARAVRDRTDLMLAQHAERDSRNHRRLAAWLEYVGREDLWGKSMKSLRNYTVCSDNFRQHDFMNAEHNSLTKLAAPSVPPPTQGVDPLATQSAGEDEIVVDSVWVAASLKAHGYEVIVD
ncbi:hypothetical protein MTO96_050182, partial [Rhipicephalus appendiculatus]